MQMFLTIFGKKGSVFEYYMFEILTTPSLLKTNYIVSFEQLSPGEMPDTSPKNGIFEN